MLSQFFSKNRFHIFKFIALFLLTFPVFTKADQLIVEPEMGRAPVLGAMQDAKYSINLVMYGMTDETLRDELIKQKNQGVAVKVILERAPYKAVDENKKTIAAFNKNQVEWIGELPNIRLIHQKTLIVDHKKALVMNFNFTHSAFKNDRNFGLIVDDAKTVNDIENAFSADWNNQAFTTDSSRVLLGPQNGRKQFLDYLSKSKTSLDIYAQDLTDSQIFDEVVKAGQRGVKIRLITSHALSPERAKYFKKVNALVHDHTPRYIHAKAIIIDKQMLIIGSTNMTQPSLNDNRELSVVSTDANVLKDIQKTFEADWLSSN